MNKFVVIYCIQLIILIVVLYLPTEYLGGTLLLICMLLFVGLSIILLSIKEGRHFDTQLMTGLLVPIYLKTFFILSSFYDKEKFDESHNVVYAVLTGKHKEVRKGGDLHYFDYHYNNDFMSIYVSSDDYYNDSLFKSALLLISPHNKILKNQVTDFEKRKFKYPVEYRNNLEYGNDSYDYCVIEPYTALNNFGLRCVTKTIEKSDTILYYCNLNPSIDSVAHRLADTLQTASNRALVGSSFAFLFHDGIYTKEQVFEEIPQAKEYYLRYCKETDRATNIISDTTTNTP